MNINNPLSSLNPIQYRSGFAGLYIHFPFCIQKCGYCDFYSIESGKDRIPDEYEIIYFYNQEINSRIQTYPKWLDYKFDSVFFGGGTPSRMAIPLLEDFLSYLRMVLPLTHDAEISMEANPEDISKENLDAWHSIGFNRINMGYQTTHQKHLEGVGRYYDKKIYKEAPKFLANSSIERFGFDLIYGFPEETMEEFFIDLEFLMDFCPNHISIYSLTMEKGTEYSRAVREGRTREPEEYLQTEIFSNLPNIMRDWNFDWYEVSNFCLPGNHSQHNLKYWSYQPYLGIGPSASGFSGDYRYTNPKNLNIYKKNPGRTKNEPLDIITELSLGLLRLIPPIDWNGFLNLFSPSTRNEIRNLLRNWADKGFAEWDSEKEIFQWKENSLLFLDDRIKEFSSLKKNH